MGPLAETLSRALAEPSAPEAAAGLGAVVKAFWGRAREPWPGIDLPAETFLTYVADRLPEESNLEVALPTLHAGDLYLACGCARRLPAALSAFERHFMSRIGSYLARADALPSFTDEVKQVLRARLLVAEGELLPRIGQYSGRGPLGAWLWMTATRVALDLRRAQRGGGPTAADQVSLLADLTVTPDPELAHLKARYAPVFRRTFREVLGTLSDRDGALLRLHYLEGMSAEQIAALYGVSRWTASRWMAHLCEEILRETRRRLAAQLGIPAGQVESLLRLVRSQMSLSVADALSGPS